MAKRKRASDSDKISRWIHQGRGQGIGEDYKPWLRVQDVPSCGRVSRIRGIKTNRIHHLMSDLETGYLYMLDSSDNVLDIREQFPLLPLEQTQDIAEELGIKHPADPHTKEDIVMTTDFLITINMEGNSCNIARTVKPANELEKERALEKLQIEKIYWEKNNVNWGIVTNNEINDILVQNLKIVHQYYNITTCSELDGIPKHLADKCKLILLDQLKMNKTVNSVCYECDKRLGISTGVSLAMFKHLIATKDIEADLITKIMDYNSPMEVKLHKLNSMTEEGVV